MWEKRDKQFHILTLIPKKNLNNYQIRLKLEPTSIKNFQQKPLKTRISSPCTNPHEQHLSIYSKQHPSIKILQNTKPFKFSRTLPHNCYYSHQKLLKINPVPNNTQMIGTANVLRKMAQLTARSAMRASFDCDQCHKHLKNPECNACHKMINYFNMFEIPQEYEVNSTAISERAKQLQKQFHPDKNVVNEDGGDFQKYSAYINNAKSTLLDDLKRAVYMMQLKGVHIDDQSNIHDSEFMMDMFELQQQIEAASPKQAQLIKVRIDQILSDVKKDIGGFFQSEDLAKCKQFVFKYKYLHRALENLKNKLP